eukprot:TRINITY_DN3635_c0_g1_i1.p1 TRINITY_DN3635_c0_g1~~TRINITY_DN3635_c0_g1_i1.p1  ORF type:complete len:149 (-),score=8.53 TRINITY_DN3635_c0_g1_i1:402-848(-)
MYFNEIFNSLMQSETEKSFFSNAKLFSCVQGTVTQRMRMTLISWLIEVSLEFRSEQQTIQLTVDYIDRFLIKREIQVSSLQLLGITAMFIASKYEEILPPPLNKFVEITDRTYTRSEMLRMEHEILNTLQFQLTVPTRLNFIECLSRL